MLSTQRVGERWRRSGRAGPPGIRRPGKASGSSLLPLCSECRGVFVSVGPGMMQMRPTELSRRTGHLGRAQRNAGAIAVDCTTRTQVATSNTPSTDSLDKRWRSKAGCRSHPNHPLTPRSFLMPFKMCSDFQGVRIVLPQIHMINA